MTADGPPCPLCGRLLGEPHPIHVCSGCHQSIRAAGELKVRSTGEFTAMTPERADELLAEPTFTTERPADGPCCTFCGKPRDAVARLLSSGQAHICNECVALCADILASE